MPDYNKLMRDAAKQYQDALKQNAGAAADEYGELYNKAGEDMQAIADQQAQANASAIDEVRRANEAQEKSAAQMILDMKAEDEQEAREAQQRIDAAHRAASWTGAGKLAASLINLFSVGELGAVNQEYKSYSQDWMKKADDEAREHRARMRSSRDRRRAVQERLDALRSGNAKTLAQMRLGASSDNAKAQQQIINLGLTGGEKGVQARYNAGNEGAKAGLEATKAGAQLGLQQASQQQTAARHAASMRARGLNPDGSFNKAYYDEGVAGGTIKASSGSGSSSGNNYDLTIGGNHITLSMSKETYNAGVHSGTAELKRDIMRKNGFEGGDWNEFVARTQDKKDPLYNKEQGIIGALSGRGGAKADYEVIERYVNDNKDDLEEFNTHMYRVATGAKNFGPLAVGQQAQEENTDWDQFKVKPSK